MNCFKSFESSTALKCISTNSALRQGSRLFHASASRFKNDERNHYEVLEIKKDSTTKEIRDAFLKLSKENHPDKNQSDPQTHDKFVRINEAYSVLSQPGLRASYDMGLPSKHSIRHDGGRGGSGYHVHVRRPGFSGRPGEDFVIRETLRKARANASNHKHYYGVPGIEKKTNFQFFLFLAILSLSAGYFQYFLVKYANSNIRANFQQRTQEYNMFLNELNLHAEKHGDKFVLSEILNEEEVNPNDKESEHIKTE